MIYLSLIHIYHQGKRLTRPGVTYILNKYMVQVSWMEGKKGVTPHVIRHSKAMHLLLSLIHISVKAIPAPIRIAAHIADLTLGQLHQLRISGTGSIYKLYTGQVLGIAPVSYTHLDVYKRQRMAIF